MQFKPSMFNVPIRHDGSLYVFNTFSNGLSKFTDDVYAHIQDGTPEQTPYLDALVAQGFVVPEPMEELNRLLVERIAYQYGRSRSMQFLIVPSLACNLKCVYCYQRDVSFDHSVMDDETVERSIRFIQQTVERNPYAKRLKLNWFGGEPLLHPAIIKRMTDHFTQYCAEHDLEYSANVTTNGLLLTREVCDYLCQHGLVSLQVTIDGDERFYVDYKHGKPGDLERLVENVAYAAQFVDINIRFNTSAENRESILEIASALAERLPMGRIQMYPARIYDCEGIDGLTGLSPEEFDAFNQVFCERFSEFDFDVEYSRVSERLAYCGSMRRDYAIIGPRGELYRCEHQIGQPDEVIGDVRYGFYRNEADMKFLNMPYPQECRNCNLLPYCCGGCPSDRICAHKQFDCDAFRKKFDAWVVKRYLEGRGKA